MKYLSRPSPSGLGRDDALSGKKTRIESEQREETPSDGTLTVYLNPYEQHITLNSGNSALVQQLGKAFDAELGKGRFQAFFGRFE
ncbi:MAG: hypothetical protein IPK76_02920 [Lewinellaceae bacterium]|nr:hypothetical protein [Lewinellaceae bacterium]